MRKVGVRRMLAVAVTVVGVLVSATSASAQRGSVITGRVTTAGQPLGGASVGIPELADRPLHSSRGDPVGSIVAEL